MDSAGIEMILTVIGTVTVLMLYPFFSWKRDLRKRVRLLAEYLHGEMIGSGPFEIPSIRFKVHNYKALFTFGTSDRAFTKVTVWVPSYRGGRLIIVPERLGGQFHRLFGVHDIEIGDREFDRTFIIQAQPESTAHRVFDPAQRKEAMEAVWRPAHFNHFMLRVENGRLELMYHERVIEAPALLALLRAATDLIPLLLSRPHTGMEFGDATVEADGRCPICTTALSEPLVHCKRCSAPHHRECWDYLGRCAVYACEPARRSA